MITRFTDCVAMTDLPTNENENSIKPTDAVQVRPKKKKRSKPKHAPRYHVVLWNDDDHTYEYVVHMLQVLFGYPPEKGYQLAREVDTRGKAVIFTSSLEKAEIKRDQILSFGPDPLMKKSVGPLIATIEKDRENDE